MVFFFMVHPISFSTFAKSHAFMRKGMIHTVSYNWSEVEQGAYAVFDLSKQLTQKLQKMVRQGSIFKIVGIDINTLVDASGTRNESGVSGVMRYFTPTKGRCDAWRSVFLATQKWRKAQGVPPNYNYDFRLGFDAGTVGASKVDFGAEISNQAWLEYYADDSTEASPQGLFLINSLSADSQQSIFDVHNLGIEMNDGASAPSFGQGWTPYSPFQSADEKIDMDFVKNEEALLVTNPNGPEYASLSADYFSFGVYATQDDDNGHATVPFMWRPVSNEYLPSMCGLFEMQVTDTIQEDDIQTLIVTFYVAGWSSILRRRGRKKSKK